MARRLLTDPSDPYAIVMHPTPVLPRDRGKRYATIPKAEHNPFGGTTMYHDTLEEARERNRWARTLRGWEAETTRALSDPDRV